MGTLLHQLLLQFPPSGWRHPDLYRSPPAASIVAARPRRAGCDGRILAREHALPIVYPDAASAQVVGPARRARRLRRRDDDSLCRGARCPKKATKVKAMKMKITMLLSLA